MSRIRTVLGLAAGVVMLFGHAAQAQSNYPSRPIRIVVPYPAGGIVDIVARAVTEQVGRDWKQTVIVEARPGGNSNIGTSAVARSEPDGYTWLVTGPAALVNPTLYKDADILKANPFMGELLDVFTNAVARPATATGLKYPQVSQAFWDAAHDVLEKKSNGADAVKKLEASLKQVKRNKW